MVTLHELRHFCKLTSISEIKFRTLLIAAAIFDRNLINEILHNCSFSFTHFIWILKSCKEDDLEEERLLIDVIMYNDNPSGFDLLRILCESDGLLCRALTNSGLSIEMFANELDRHISSNKKKVIAGNDFKESSHTRFSKIQLN